MLLLQTRDSRALVAPQYVDSSWARGQTHVPCTRILAGGFLTIEPLGKSIKNKYWSYHLQTRRGFLRLLWVSEGSSIYQAYYYWLKTEGWVRCGWFVVTGLVISFKIYDFMNTIKIQEKNIKVYNIKLWIILQITWKQINVIINVNIN